MKKKKGKHRGKIRNGKDMGERWKENDREG